jgi:AbrB family looped-hinge helix DNA binding protein
MSVRGQVVIPEEVRKKLHLRPRDRFIVYGEGDAVVMKRLDLPELREVFDEIGIFVRERNKKYGKLTEEDVNKEVSAVRHKS